MTSAVNGVVPPYGFLKSLRAGKAAPWRRAFLDTQASSLAISPSAKADHFKLRHAPAAARWTRDTSSDSHESAEPRRGSPLRGARVQQRGSRQRADMVGLEKDRVHAPSAALTFASK